MLLVNPFYGLYDDIMTCGFEMEVGGDMGDFDKDRMPVARKVLKEGKIYAKARGNAMEEDEWWVVVWDVILVPRTIPIRDAPLMVPTIP